MWVNSNASNWLVALKILDAADVFVEKENIVFRFSRLTNDKNIDPAIILPGINILSRDTHSIVCTQKNQLYWCTSIFISVVFSSFDSDFLSAVNFSSGIVKTFRTFL